MKKVVITGATGAIGHALINCLIEQEIEVLVIIHKGSNRLDTIPDSPYVKRLFGELNELSTIDVTEYAKDYEVFYHFAWDGGKYRQDFERNIQNVEFTLQSIELAKKLGCKKYIGAGSQAEYGIQSVPLSGKTIPLPKTAFGAAKLLAGVVGQKKAEELHMEYIWVRILSVYGPYDGMQTLVSSLIKDLLMGQSKKLSKCEQMWDFLYSDDAARAMKLIGERGINGKVYTLGSGVARPLRDYVDIIHAYVNKEVTLQIGAIPYAADQVMYLCADISELTKDTGFKPEVTFDSGIEKTVKWMKSTESDT